MELGGIMKTPLIVKIDFEVPFLNLSVGVIYYEISSRSEEIKILQELGSILKNALKEYRKDPYAIGPISSPMQAVRKSLILHIIDHNGYVRDEILCGEDERYLEFLKEKYGFEGNKNDIYHAYGILTTRGDLIGDQMIEANKINYIVIKEDDSIEFYVNQSFTEEELDVYYQTLSENEV